MNLKAVLCLSFLMVILIYAFCRLRPYQLSLNDFGYPESELTNINSYCANDYFEIWTDHYLVAIM